MQLQTGKTTAGDPYEAKFPDKFGNVCVREVARPDILSKYFKYSNSIDVHNQSRQYDLSLEKKWVTQDPYFRLYTTSIGMLVTDMWRIYREHIQDSLASSIVHFADALAYQIIESAKEKGKEHGAREEPVNATQSNAVNATQSNAICISIDPTKEVESSLSCPSGHNQSHQKVYLKGKQLRCIWCSRVNYSDRKTTLKCLECNKGFCRDDSGRHCWSLHVAHGGLPTAPKRGMIKKKKEESRE